MAYGDPYRSSTGNLGPSSPRASQRWDRERFESFSNARGGGGYTREFEEDRDIKHGGGRFEERDRYVEEDRYSRPPPRRPIYYDDNDSPPPRRSPIVEQGYGPPARRSRPQFLRRQSSLDTFDRRPMPRYGDRELEVIPVQLPPKRMIEAPPPRRRREMDFEEIKIVDPDVYGDEEYRRPPRRRSVEKFEFEEEVEEERPYPRRGKTRMPRRLANPKAIIALGYPFEEEEDTIIILKALGKEHIDQIVRVSEQMSDSRTTYTYPREQQLLEPPPLAAPPPPPPAAWIPPPPPPPAEIIEKRTEIIRPASPQWPVGPPPLPVPLEVIQRSVRGESPRGRSRRGSPEGRTRRGSSAGRTRHGSSTRRSRRESSPGGRTRRGSSPGSPRYERKTIIDREESASIHGPLTMILPERRKNEESIKAEIRALEAEKKALKYEREYEREQRRARELRDGRDSSELVVKSSRPRSKSVVVEKDRKERPNSRLIDAMLATLT